MTARRWLLLGLGMLSMSLGLVGVFVPLLPTTPLLLLAAACFARSSPRLHAWLLGHRWFGPYIRGYREQHAISARAKAFTLTLLWASLGYAIWAHATQWWLRALLAAIGVGVTAHILTLGTLRYKEHSPSDAKDDESAQS